MERILNFEPKKVFTYFEDLTRIPRGSGNEKEVSDYLVEFAKSNNLEGKIRTIKNGNVSIISDKYLRTDGDKNKHNDMLDLDNCDEFIMDIMNDTFWKNAKIVR